MALTEDQERARWLTAKFGPAPAAPVDRATWADSIADYIDAHPLPEPTVGQIYDLGRGRRGEAIAAKPGDPTVWIYRVINSSVVVGGSGAVPLYLEIATGRVPELRPMALRAPGRS